MFFGGYYSNEHSDLGSIACDETSVDDRDVELSKFDRMVANEKLFGTRKGDERNTQKHYISIRICIRTENFFY